MDAKTPRELNDGLGSASFRTPADFLSDLDPSTTAEIVTAAADIAIVVEDGVVKDIALGEESLVAEGYDESWRGQPWIDTVTVESRPKIEELLTDRHGGEKWRQVNHPSQSALDLPVRYTAVKLGPGNRYVALGRELRAVSALQQRLIEAHQDLERDYSRMREAQGRYKILFESVSEAVLVINAADLGIEEANPAASRLIEQDTKSIVGQSLTDLFDASEARRINGLAAECMSGGTASADKLKLASGKQVGITASAFREDRATRLIVQLASGEVRSAESGTRQSLLSALHGLPDGLVLADNDQRIVATNASFARLAKISGDTEATGSRLEDFLGRSATDLNVLFSTLRKHGVIRNFATVIRDRFGDEEPVEVSAVAAPAGEEDMFAFSVRSVARRLPSSMGLDEQLPSTAAQFTELVGRVPLKDIVMESTVLIERLCIEAALEITDNNRASAAEMLGLSRQGLYSKLKRAGLGNGD